jgi:cellobiose transport system permease protein
MTTTTGDRPTPPRAPEHDPASDGSHRPQHTQSQVDRGIIFRARLGRLVTHAGIIFGVILSIFPFYWLLVMSTSTTAQIFGYPPKLTFGTSFGTNLSNLLSSIDIVSALVNTIIVSTLCAVLVMFFDSLAAFTFAKYDFPGRTRCSWSCWQRSSCRGACRSCPASSSCHGSDGSGI